LVRIEYIHILLRNTRYFIFYFISGRNGISKRKLLCCEYDTGKLFFASESMSSTSKKPESTDDHLDEIDDAKILNLSDIIELRRGTDIDPESPYKAIELAAKAGKIFIIIIVMIMIVVINR